MRKPMVDPELLEQVQGALAENTTAGHETRRPKEFPLSGNIHCAICGAAMFGSTKYRDGNAYPRSAVSKVIYARRAA